MKTRCRSCRRLIDFGKTYCSECEKKLKKEKSKNLSNKNKIAEYNVKSANWRRVRAEIIRRDNGCCVLCYVRGKIEYKQLQVHHIVKRINNLDLSFEESNLVTVCRSCHEELEKISAEEQRKLLKINNKKVNEELHFLL